jgi:DNA helicase TIP49 (TBP-interacting protein)
MMAASEIFSLEMSKTEALTQVRRCTSNTYISRQYYQLSRITR